MVGENSPIYAIQITRKCIYKSKKLIKTFLLTPPGKILPQVLIITQQADEISSFPQGRIFSKICFPEIE